LSRDKDSLDSEELIYGATASVYRKHIRSSAWYLLDVSSNPLIVARTGGNNTR